MAKTRRQRKQTTKAASMTGALRTATRSFSAAAAQSGKILIGNKQIKSIKYANADIIKIYVGNSLIYANDNFAENTQQEDQQIDSNSSNTIPNDTVITPQQ